MDDGAAELVGCDVVVDGLLPGVPPTGGRVEQAHTVQDPTRPRNRLLGEPVE